MIENKVGGCPVGLLPAGVAVYPEPVDVHRYTACPASR